MPRKGKRNGKQAKTAKPEAGPLGGHLDWSDENSVAETCSVMSDQSDLRSVMDEGPVSADEAEEMSKLECFEEKLKEFIESATQKSAVGRTGALTALNKSFMNNYVPDFIADRYVTICDIVVRSLKKGKSAEQTAAAALGVLICLQLGLGPESEEVIKEIQPVYLTLLQDKATNPGTREKCATSLAMLSFLVVEDIEEIRKVMTIMENIFKHGEPSMLKADITPVYAAAVSAWSLLLTILTPTAVAHMTDQYLPHMISLLYCPDVNVRCSAGEAIALLYEISREYDEDWDYHSEDMENKIRGFLSESQRYYKKEDRKQQKSSFRDILHTIEMGVAPNDMIKFGREVLRLKSWRSKVQYGYFCELLGSGTNSQLCENELLRDVFDLGAPLLITGPLHKTSKLERHLTNLAVSKVRNVNRGKFRDKRNAVFS